MTQEGSSDGLQASGSGPAAERYVESYLTTLADASPSTQRQRTWALRELLASPGASSPTALLDPAHIRSWLDAAATADPPASLPGLRARASAVRALARHGETSRALPAGTSDALAPVLRMPAPPLAPGPAPDPVRRLLVAAHPDRRPLAVHPAVWTRFCAHVHLLALTGEREDVMAQLRLDDVVAGPAASHISQSGDDDGPSAISHRQRDDESHIDGDAVTPPLFTTAEEVVDWERARQEVSSLLSGPPVAAAQVRIERGLNPRSWRLPEPARTAVTGWLADRAVLAALLQGASPAALWLRVRPSTDLRTGALRPAGLPVSDRGLRLAFTTTVGVLALEDRALEDLSTAAVRAFARGRGPM